MATRADDAWPGSSWCKPEAPGTDLHHTGKWVAIETWLLNLGSGV